WLATGLVVLTFPFVARATFDEYDGGDALPAETPPPGEDAPILDAGPSDAATPQPDGSRTTFGDDAGGISCTTRHPGGSTGGGAVERAPSVYASCVGAVAVCATRRARGRRRSATAP